MGESPAMVRNQDKGMDYQSSGVAEGFGGGQRLVPAFMSKFPETGEHESLTESIDCPGDNAKAIGRDVWYLGRNCCECEDEEEIADHVG